MAIQIGLEDIFVIKEVGPKKQNDYYIARDLNKNIVKYNT